MSFKFNFNSDNKIPLDTSVRDSDKDIGLPFEEIVPTESQIENVEQILHAKMFTCDDIEIGYVAVSDAISEISKGSDNNYIFHADKQNSDLLTAKYEGGIKIWECTEDLVKYLNENKSNIQFKNQKVLDLGCGAGVLGIFTYLQGAEVTFQDYNKEVIEHVTINNVLLNIEDEIRKEEILKCRFFSGDWENFNRELEETETYDLILTSETIYNSNNYHKLVELFSKRLKKTGAVYLAAKSYYFGVGGGINEFVSKCESNGLKCEVCWKNIIGLQRYIVKITHQ